MIDVLLLLGLPASGKSEIRRFLSRLPSDLRLADFGVGNLVQIDDFPYVWAMRTVDAFRHARGIPPAYFLSSDLPFADGREWLALSTLLRWDFAEVSRESFPRPRSAGTWILDRIERARRSVGLPAAFRFDERKLRPELEDALAADAAAALAERQAGATAPATYLVELARGGADWMRPPLPEPLGYEASLPVLGEELLSRAAILHVKVSPEESYRRNLARSDPSKPGSILGHSVPPIVMRHDYGYDDLEWLDRISDVPGTIAVQCTDRVVHVPVAVFDNQVDLTSFARQAVSGWSRAKVETLYDQLAQALAPLADAAQARQVQHEGSRAPAEEAYHDW